VRGGDVVVHPKELEPRWFGWVDNMHDWCISRQLWWGHRIPVWYSPDGEMVCLGPDEEPPAGWTQDEDVLDTWFSSGLWPFSTLGWPEQTAELRTFYPNSVMETGHDIIFFWVARMMMMGLHFMGDVPFRTVYLHAMVRDEKGEKMSKTKGNVIDPLDVIRGAPAKDLAPALKNKFPQGMPAFGADALRFTLASLTQQGRDIKLSLDRVAGYKAFTNKVWNASRFALMNLGSAPPLPLGEGRLALADRWILSRLNRAIRATTAALERFDFGDAASTVYQFLWSEFCDWYIELSKPSLYGDDVTAKDTTRAVLVFSLDRILRLLHPFMPFITEEIWQKLPLTHRPAESIVVAPWPAAEAGWDDPAAEREMQPVIAAIEGVRNIRGESNLPPATKVPVIVQSQSNELRDALTRYQSYVIPLTGSSELRIEGPGPKPRFAATFVGAQMEIFVPLEGLIDPKDEQARLSKELSREKSDIDQLDKQLSNPNFRDRAPREVVDEKRALLDTKRRRAEKLTEHISRIEAYLKPENKMPDEKKTNGNGSHAPQVASMVPNPETASVKIGGTAETGSVDLGKELAGELGGVNVPDTDSSVKDALDMLRKGTEKGLSSKDHYDLGVAYMGMGLVDDAVREFNRAKDGEGKPKAKAKAKARPKKKLAARAKAKPKPKPKKKAKPVARKKKSAPKRKKKR
jgi:valyl-tRNA synthetase